MRKIGVVIGSLLLAFAMLPSAFAAAGGPPATFTTINFGADEGNHCKNGQPDATTIVNCNIYEGKQYVWLNGGPENAALANGMYFFAVLVPGGQPDPNDGGAKNLSDTTAAPYGSGALNADGSAIPSGDARGNRTFEVSGGVVAYAGSHSFDSNKIRLMPYDDTTNEGGVYILAICKLSSDDAAVDPKDCKYDAFKVQTPEAPVTVQAVLSGTKYLDANTNGQMDPGETGLPNWTITISDGTTTSTASTDSAGDWSFTTPAVAEGTPETFTVSEVQQSGYAQTGNTVDQSSATGGVTVALSNKIYALTLPNTGPGSASGLNFGNIPLASALTASKSATPAFTRTFKWDISKDVDKTELDIAAGGSATFTYTVSVTHDAGADSGWNVSGNITVANSNSAAATIDSITDAINDGNAVCAVTGTFPATIAASDSSIFAYSCSYSAAPAASGQTNTATVAWSQQTLGNATLLVAGSATATADISWGAPTTIVDGSVSVSDALDSSSPRSFSYTDASPSTFTYSHTFTGDPAGTCTTHDNTATFTTNTSRTTGSASQTVKVCVGADLTVTKTATPTFTRTYNWNISKAVDKTLVKQVGGTATFNYTVVAAQTGFVDSAWAVSGTITVSNPNDWEAITATVTDAIDNGGTCTVTNGTNVSILAGGSVTFVYACTYTAPNPLTGGTNTATAAWDKTTSATPNASATGSAAVSFTTPTSAVNKTITVTDTFNGGTPTTLGTLTATDGAPFTTRTFTYSHSISVPAFDCKSYTNTATIVETGQNASQTVTVCGPEKTGALTMGFWQNKNGQGIISGGASTAGVCNSATWLRQYAPFQDLSATATCAGVATYVSNVIKAASSAGDSMNPMLKGQMLATALDVYFSDAALGGNKIGAPGPIGGDSVDLTKICTNIPTCTTFVNSSSAFGGAASMTVSQILTYAASQSNAGGSTWYANLKSTQELAKDVFDAINNQVAFAP